MSPSRTRSSATPTRWPRRTDAEYEALLHGETASRPGVDEHTRTCRRRQPVITLADDQSSEISPCTSTFQDFGHERHRNQKCRLYLPIDDPDTTDGDEYDPLERLRAASWRRLEPSRAQDGCSVHRVRCRQGNGSMSRSVLATWTFTPTVAADARADRGYHGPGRVTRDADYLTFGYWVRPTSYDDDGGDLRVRSSPRSRTAVRRNIRVNVATMSRLGRVCRRCDGPLHDEDVRSGTTVHRSRPTVASSLLT